MKYDFDSIVERRGTDSIKWNNEYTDQDILPMWVADMDFKSSPKIIEGLEARIRHGVYGYYKIDDTVFQSVIDFMKSRHRLDIEKSDIVFVPGVVTGLNVAMEAILKDGDNIIVQPPIYTPFLNLDTNRNIEILENPLIKKDTRYEMDFENLEEIINERTKAIVIANPHNPTGRVWSAEELARLSSLAMENNILIISDDIHSDIIREGEKYTPIINISEEVKMNSISFFSPSKTFNIAGFSTSVAIIPNKDIRDKFIGVMDRLHIPATNILGKEALKIAYGSCEDWLDELNLYIDGNFKVAKDYIDENIKDLVSYIPEGTYLMWLDFSKLNLSNEKINEALINTGKVYLKNGADYGQGGEGYFRINLGTPRKLLLDGLERIKKTVDSLK